MNHRIKPKVRLFEGIQKGLIIGLPMKDTLTPSPTVHNMIHGPGILNAGRSGQGERIKYIISLKKIGLTPF